MADGRVADANLPALPTVLRGGAIVERAQWWLRGLGRHAGWIAGALPIVTIGGSILFIGLFFDIFCGYGGGCEAVGVGVLGLWIIGCILLFLFSIATLFARAGARRRLLQTQARYQPRLQGAKDWFIRDDITDADYDALKARIEPCLKGETTGARAHEAATLLTVTGVLFCVLLVVLIPFDVVFLFEAGGFLAFLFLVFSTGTTGAGAFLGLRHGARLRADAVQLTTDLDQEITRHEEELLRAGHGRKRGVVTSRPATGSTPGPAYSPYLRR